MSSFKVRVLGCGGSRGVPALGFGWGECDPTNPKNRRTRPSILIQTDTHNILVDCGPDVREQLLRHNISKIDALIFTHAHADHTHGIDELIPLRWYNKEVIPAYADAATFAALTARFDYCFTHSCNDEHYPPFIMLKPLHHELHIGGLHLRFFVQDHGYMQSVGIRVGDFAYSTDVKSLDEAAWQALAGTKTWLVDATRHEPLPTHSHVAQTVQWVEKLQATQAFLTHMNQNLDYEALCAMLPTHIRPAYDGLLLEF